MIYGNVFCEEFAENSLFDPQNPRNSDGLFDSIVLLREKFLQHGIEVNTPDLNSDRAVSFELYLDGRAPTESSLPKYIITFENPFINKLNADIGFLRNFRRVFTWNEDVLGLPGSIRIFIPNSLKLPNLRRYHDRQIYSCLISSNKNTPWGGANDLYAERINVIRWYEKNAPNSFHLYGKGWNKPNQAFTLKGRIIRRVNRLRTQLYGYKPFPSWRGAVKYKSAILVNARFSYCYENVKGLRNYITEKIFDSFFSGCVPIYWGADNVLEHIPQECFIDRRQFADTAEVHRYLLSITPERHEQFQNEIGKFLKSKQAFLFSTENFVATIVNTLADDFQQQSAASRVCT